VRAVWLFAIAGVIGCSDKAPPPEPGIEATVVEVKQVATAEPPAAKPVEAPPPKPVEAPKPSPVVVKPTKHVQQAPVKKPPPPATGSAQTPPPDPNKPTLEQNPYVYK